MRNKKNESTVIRTEWDGEKVSKNAWDDNNTL